MSLVHQLKSPFDRSREAQNFRLFENSEVWCAPGMTTSARWHWLVPAWLIEASSWSAPITCDHNHDQITGHRVALARESLCSHVTLVTCKRSLEHSSSHLLLEAYLTSILSVYIQNRGSPPPPRQRHHQPSLHLKHFIVRGQKWKW